MSRDERTGERDLLYNDWHREHSLTRWLTPVEAFNCAAIDIDFCEWCRKCYEPIALVETQRSRRFDKPYTITRNLALAAGIPAWVVSYWTTDDGLDIEGMRVQQVAPSLEAPAEIAPADWAKRLRRMRQEHELTDCKSPHAERGMS